MAEKAPTTCVLYDPADGSVVLTHTVVRLRGSTSGGPQDAEDEARAILSRRKPHRPDLKALHVETDAIKPGAAYRVSNGKLTPAKFAK